MKKLILLILVFIVVSNSGIAADEVLCYTQRVTDASSFNIYTGRNDANNPIKWTHNIPEGILEKVVRVGLYIEAYDVDYPSDDEHDRVYFNGYDLGLLEGSNNTWFTVEKTVPVDALKSGINELKVNIDELGKTWKVTIRASELRFYCSSEESDFSIGLSPQKEDVIQGESAMIKIDLVALNGFNSPVVFSISGLPAGVSALFSPNALIPTGSSELTLSTNINTEPGTYTIEVRGTGGGKTHSKEIELTVKKQEQDSDFSIKLTPETIEIIQGESADLKIDLVSLNGFDKSVKFYVSDLPAGSSAKFTPETIIPSGSSSLEISTETSVEPGTYTIRITGKGGEKTHSKKISLTIKPIPEDPDFILNVSPGSKEIIQGESGTFKINLTPLNGFESSVSLTHSGLQSGISAEFSSNNIKPGEDSKLTISTLSSLEPGTYTINIIGTGGGKTHSKEIILSINIIPLKPDFTININPKTKEIIAGYQGTFNINLVSIDEFNSNVDLKISGLPKRWTAKFSKESLIPDAGTELIIKTDVNTSPGTYKLNITGTGGGKTHSKQIEIFIKEGVFVGEITNDFSRTEARSGDFVFLNIKFRSKSDVEIKNIEIYSGFSEHLEYISNDSELNLKIESGTYYWLIPEMNNGETKVINVKLRVREDGYSGKIDNISYLTHSSMTDRLVSNSTSLLIQKDNVKLNKTVDKTQIKAADELNYILTINNKSSFPVKDVVIEDILSEHLEFHSQESDLVFSNTGNKLIWKTDLDIEKEVKIKIRVKVRSSVYSGVFINNKFEVSSPDMSEDLKSNTVSSKVSGEQILPGDVKFKKKTLTLQSKVGGIVRFRLSIENKSKSILIAPRIIDYLPQGFVYVKGSSVLDLIGIADPVGKNTITWNLPDILANRSVSLTFQTIIGADVKRGKNINKARLFAIDSTGTSFNLDDSDFINVSTIGLVFYSGVEGRVFIDTDLDGFYSPADRPLQGIEIRLSSGDRMITDKRGEYSFEDLKPGEYAVGVNRRTLPEKYRLFSESPVVTTLFDGLTDQKDFGLVFNGDNTEKPCRLEGVAFVDKNKNKKYDEGEQKLGEYTVTLDGKRKTRVRKDYFVFTHLKEGVHSIKIEYGNKMIKRDINIKVGKNMIYFPIKFTGIEVIVGRKK